MKKLLIALFCAAVVLGMVAPAIATVISSSPTVVSYGYAAVAANQVSAVISDPAANTTDTWVFLGLSGYSTPDIRVDAMGTGTFTVKRTSNLKLTSNVPFFYIIVKK